MHNSHGKFSLFEKPVKADSHWGPFLEGPETFSHPESRRKISNIVITEPFY